MFFIHCAILLLILKEMVITLQQNQWHDTLVTGRYTDIVFITMDLHNGIPSYMT